MCLISTQKVEIVWMAHLHLMIDSENVYTYHPLLTVGIACLDAHLKVSQLSCTLITNNQCTVEKYAHEYHRTMLIHMLRGIYRYNRFNSHVQQVTQYLPQFFSLSVWLWERLATSIILFNFIDVHLILASGHPISCHHSICHILKPL